MADGDGLEDEAARAGHAYQLLNSFTTLPGTTDRGLFDGQAFVAWVNAVKKSAKESGHLEVALHQAGAVLVHSPPDSDGLWMHRDIAGVLNREDMTELRAGYSIAIYNSRGVHNVDPTGKPEQELALKYDRRADEIENVGYHRLAATLRELAATYRREADTIVAQRSPP